ncbi:hypothetical protein Zmor_015747 [Zophobas morio]|uniref:Peptidase S1 domain-containing protein n=1 Tax=Zophobas morio TaxID=2755281 RepID=A0AA38MHW6_9CUCU|nr:hypothetical protein Zmor_015747 [Zophobas morio]
MCVVPNTKKTGRCIKMLDCDYAKELLRRGLSPGHCGFMGNSVLACCPNAKQPGVLSQEMCTHYYKVGDPNVATIVGEHMRTKEFPHMVAVGYGASKVDTVWLCGGSLISHYFVLSAAHCVYSVDFGQAMWIRMENFGIKSIVDDATPHDIKIADRYVHPKYKRSSFYHDIALYRMEEKVTFDFSTRPVCLHTEKDVPVDILQATGWGKVGFFGLSMYLLKVDLHIVDHRTCARKYASVSNTRKLRDGIQDDLQICAGDAMGKDTYPGDSGGPLQYHVKRIGKMLPHFKIVGITSFGKQYGMTSSAGVYTRVSSYLDWIESIVWAEDEGA